MARGATCYGSAWPFSFRVETVEEASGRAAALSCSMRGLSAEHRNSRASAFWTLLLCSTSMTGPRAEVSARVRYKIHQTLHKPGLLQFESAFIKEGPRVWKTLTISGWGDSATGTVKKRKMYLKTWQPKYSQHKVLEDVQEQGSYSWWCENDEIAHLQAVLNRELPASGAYRRVSRGSAVDEVLSHVESGGLQADDLAQVAQALLSIDGLSSALRESEQGRLFARAVTAHNRTRALVNIRNLVQNAGTLEPQLQREFQQNWWIFGGQYLRQADRRGLTVLDQLDIPLIRHDGSLHIVELKRANIPELVRVHRNHLIVGDDVHEAVSQAVNYLRAMDEERHSILANLKTDTRRASATVVIGHPAFLPGAISRVEVYETLRTYASHVARVEVLTYEELVDGAMRALSLGTEPQGAGLWGLSS